MDSWWNWFSWLLVTLPWAIYFSPCSCFSLVFFLSSYFFLVSLCCAVSSLFFNAARQRAFVPLPIHTLQNKLMQGDGLSVTNTYLCTRHQARGFHSLSRCLHWCTRAIEEYPLFNWDMWGPSRWLDFPQISHLVSSRSWNPALVSRLQIQGSGHCLNWAAKRSSHIWMKRLWDQIPTGGVI